MKELLIWRFFKAGYPTCCEQHARRYWMILWDLGDTRETQFKLSLN